MICEKCGKEVEAIKKPGYIGHSVSRISGQSKTKFYRVSDQYQSVEKHDCVRKETHEEKIRRIKDAGLPTQIEQSV